MIGEFHVADQVDRPIQDVWTYLTDLSNAPNWMTGVSKVRQMPAGSMSVGARFQFSSRGKERLMEVTALDPLRHMSLTSKQGGVCATYTYSLCEESGVTHLKLHAVCTATGLWNLLHPLIVYAMRRADGSHLANLRLAMAESRRL